MEVLQKLKHLLGMTNDPTEKNYNSQEVYSN